MRPFQGGTSIVDYLCLLCLAFHMLLCLFIAVFWSPTGKGLTSWLLLDMFIVFLLLSHMVFWVIVSFTYLCRLSYFHTETTWVLSDFSEEA